ncbi:MAG: NAD(P)/FAD-dependent oxidoreductase [Planctomycetales bacterium]|nr:NAD(P)/FAD-dependent oxidoreductase [Planctomycetales bacterium]
MSEPKKRIGIQNLDDDWDCVVIGAGPAGTMAARQAAMRGLKTLIVDRKTFPREKVCGACVNRRALTLLDQVGLGHVVHNCRGIPFDRIQLRCPSGHASLPLSRGFAVSRATLDDALVEAAVSEGATFVSDTMAQILPTEHPAGDRGANQRSVKLIENHSDCTKPHSRTVRCQIVIAADGLGHPSLQRLPDFHDKVARSSRIGVGTIVEHGANVLREGSIGMAVGRDGYVGMVRISHNRLNVAACLDVTRLRDVGHPGVVVADILQRAGFADFGAADHTWKGTIQLSRSTNTVASQGILVVGDAAGYVEPFTGEGIAWALAGGVAVGDCAASGAHVNQMTAEQIWKREWRQLVARRQKWCRRLAVLLRHPTAVSVAIYAASTFPFLANRIIASLDSPALELQATTS